MRLKAWGLLLALALTAKHLTWAGMGEETLAIPLLIGHRLSEAVLSTGTLVESSPRGEAVRYLNITPGHQCLVHVRESVLLHKNR